MIAVVRLNFKRLTFTKCLKKKNKLNNFSGLKINVVKIQNVAVAFNYRWKSFKDLFQNLQFKIQKVDFTSFETTFKPESFIPFLIFSLQIITIEVFPDIVLEN